MYLRIKTTPTGSVVQLVESFRDAEGRPRQRIRLSLGDASLPQSLWPLVVRGVEAQLTGQEDLSLIAVSSEVAGWVDKMVRALDIRMPPTLTTVAPAFAGAGESVLTQEKAELSSSEICDGLPALVLNGVLADRITHQDTTLLGPVLVAMKAWEVLKMPQILTELGFNRSQQQAVTAEVVNRLVDPVSEHALPGWVRSTSLLELLGENHLPSDYHGYYRACDHLLKHRAKISEHLRKREREHFNLSRTVLLYDLTNTYFEGQMLENTQAKRGKSKEKRSDCPQVVVGMVFDEHGFELGHEVFKGNTSDAKSLVDMVRHLRSAVDSEPSVFPPQRPLVIVDGGIATAENRALFVKNGFDYLANDSRPGRKKYAEYFMNDRDFVEIPDRDGTARVLVRQLADPLAKDPSTADTLILCKSAGRQAKERGIISTAEQRLLDDFKKLSTNLEKGTLKTPEKINASLTRILARHPRIARYYTANVTVHEPLYPVFSYQRTPQTTDILSENEQRLIDKFAKLQALLATGKMLSRTAIELRLSKILAQHPEAAGHYTALISDGTHEKPSLSYLRKQDTYDEADALLGCYVLRTCSQVCSKPGDWWQLYMTLSQAEDGFRALKSDLGLRPVRHQREDRGISHILVSVLAYHLLHFITFTLRQSGDTRNWSSIRRLLCTHCYTTVVIPTKTGDVHRLRLPGTPDQEQQRIYQALGIDWKKLPRHHTRA
jgi:hypothetical protein